MAQLNTPAGLAYDIYGNLYIGDANNNVIRKVTNVAVVGINQLKENKLQVAVYPNPAADKIFIELKDNSGEASEIKVFNLLGNTVKQLNNPSAGSGQAATKKISIDISELQNGVYFVRIKTNEGSVTKKIIVQH